MTIVRMSFSAIGAATLALSLGGCPNDQTGTLAEEVISSASNDAVIVTGESSIAMLAPSGRLAITGGTPVEAVWSVRATTRLSSVTLILDRDREPGTGNEIEIASGLDLSVNSRTIDTTTLSAGEYFIGVELFEIGVLTRFDYSEGSIVVNQAPAIDFTAPRDIVSHDRSRDVIPTISVAWTVTDPDSRVTTQIFLDSDSSANGNEILLRESNSQSGDSFSFDLPTFNFNAGTYRILALVNDGVQQFSFYAPGQIRLRGRLAGAIDLRDVETAGTTIAAAIFEGFNPRDNAGSFVSGVRDVDGDGFDDFVILSQFGKPLYATNLQRTGVGEAYLLYGRRQRFNGRINLNSTGTLFRGDVITGVREVADPIRPTRGITSFALLSDWDLDGVREMAFGLPFTDSLSEGFFNGSGAYDTSGWFRTGGVVVMSGVCLRPDLGFPGRSVILLSEVGTLVHEPGDNYIGTFPRCFEGFIGPKAPALTTGGDTLYYQHVAGVTSTPGGNLGSVRLGCRIGSLDFGDQFGEALAAFDFDSLAMAAPNRDPDTNTSIGRSVPGAGCISVFFNDSIGGNFPWRTTQGPDESEFFGYPGVTDPAAAAGLPHGGPYHYTCDDRGLIPIGAILRELSPGYIVTNHDFPQCTEPGYGSVPTPALTTRFYSSTNSARLSNVRSLGDFNTDGLQDLVIGAPFANEGRGATFIVLGRLKRLVEGAELELEELGLPSNSSNPPSRRVFDGIRVVGGPGERLGQSQDDAGDFNGDGVSDVIIGSTQVNNRAGGAAIFFGSREVINLTETEIPYAELPSRGLGIILTGENEGDLTGARVASVGDVDGDGNGDVMIAAPDKSIRMDLDQDGAIDIDRTNCGVVYLVYGSPRLTGTISLKDIGTEKLPGVKFIGPASGGFLGAGLGEQGDRSFGIAAAGDVDGDGNADFLMSSIKASPRDRVAAGEAYLIYGQN
ncbi:FG-GAP repeat protein [Phycisphaerae bacterium RAS1]|nr:FG-GAP repeat protein [Phycisphaerae bacterium RAS1]